jgi:ADP-ribosylglycohydrolase
MLPPLQVVLGASIDEALQWAQARGNLTAPVAALIKDALALKGQPFSAAATKLGVSCSQPGAFQGAVLAAATAGSYEDGVRANLQAGGDNCSRGVYMGALLGAAYGVPAEWKAKVTGWTEFERDIDRIVQQ